MIIVTINVSTIPGPPEKKCVKSRSLRMCAVSVCYLNEDVQHIRICHFVFPKFLDVEWCNLHGGCRERKDSEENNIIGTLSSRSVCASMHRHVWYFCTRVGQAIVSLPRELYNSSRFPRNPTAWAPTCLRPHQRLRESHTALNERNANMAEWQTEKLANDHGADEVKSKD